MEPPKAKASVPTTSISDHDPFSSSPLAGPSRSRNPPQAQAPAAADQLLAQELAAGPSFAAASKQPDPFPPPSARSGNSSGGTVAGARKSLDLVLTDSPASRKRSKNVKFSPSKGGKSLARRAVTTATSVQARAAADDAPVLNNDYCEACLGKGHFLCCDNCPRSFHFACLEPPLELDDVPKEDNWFCKACRAEKSSPPKIAKGIFGPLLNQLDLENPTSFKLPDDIRNFFKNVATGTLGEFVDSREARPLRANKQGFIEERDPFKNKDKNNKTVLCYKCRTAASIAKGKRLIMCDFCEQHWHLDCLDPPMASLLPPSKKWRCPNHIEHVVAKQRVPKQQEVVVMEERGKPNNGDIDVIPRSETPPPEMEYEEVVVSGIRYQVPEDTIILDFFDKTRGGRRRRRASDGDPPLQSQLLAVKQKSLIDLTSPLTSVETTPEPSWREDTFGGSRARDVRPIPAENFNFSSLNRSDASSSYMEKSSDNFAGFSALLLAASQMAESSPAPPSQEHPQGGAEAPPASSRNTHRGSVSSSSGTRPRLLRRSSSDMSIASTVDSAMDSTKPAAAPLPVTNSSILPLSSPADVSRSLPGPSSFPSKHPQTRSTRRSSRLSARNTPEPEAGPSVLRAPPGYSHLSSSVTAAESVSHQDTPEPETESGPSIIRIPAGSYFPSVLRGSSHVVDEGSAHRAPYVPEPEPSPPPSVTPTTASYFPSVLAPLPPGSSFLTSSVAGTGMLPQAVGQGPSSAPPSSRIGPSTSAYLYPASTSIGLSSAQRTSSQLQVQPPVVTSTSQNSSVTPNVPGPSQSSHTKPPPPVMVFGQSGPPNPPSAIAPKPSSSGSGLKIRLALGTTSKGKAKVVFEDNSNSTPLPSSTSLSAETLPRSTNAPFPSVLMPVSGPSSSSNSLPPATTDFDSHGSEIPTIQVNGKNDHRSMDSKRNGRRSRMSVDSQPVGPAPTFRHRASADLVAVQPPLPHLSRSQTTSSTITTAQQSRPSSSLTSQPSLASARQPKSLRPSPKPSTSAPRGDDTVRLPPSAASGGLHRANLGARVANGNDRAGSRPSGLTRLPVDEKRGFSPMMASEAILPSGASNHGSCSNSNSSGGSASSCELSVRSKDDLRAIMRVRNILRDSHYSTQKDNLVQFLEAENPTVPKLDYLRPGDKALAWKLPWEGRKCEKEENPEDGDPDHSAAVGRGEEQPPITNGSTGNGPSSNGQDHNDVMDVDDVGTFSKGIPGLRFTSSNRDRE